MYQPLAQTREMITPQQQTSFEQNPDKRDSFHGLFERLVNSRIVTLNSAVSKLINTYKLQAEAKLPDVSSAFTPSFEKTIEQFIPMVNSTNPIDQKDLLGKFETVVVDPVLSNDRLRVASETENDALRKARQNLAYVVTLNELNNVHTLSDQNFTLAA